MAQAYTLVAMEWKPSRWDDIGGLPYLVVDDYWSIREGQSAAREPWGWYRTGDPRVATAAHQFRVEFSGPALLARCGVERIEGATYRRESSGFLCQRCDALSQGRAFREGTIGDLEEEERRAFGG